MSVRLRKRHREQTRDGAAFPRAGAFEQFLGGPLVVYLASSSTTVNIGSVTQPTGAGPVEVTITATRDTLAPINNALVQGSFKVGIRVPAAAGRPRSYDANIATVIYYRALAL